jgi:Caspase domain
MKKRDFTDVDINKFAIKSIVFAVTLICQVTLPNALAQTQPGAKSALPDRNLQVQAVPKPAAASSQRVALVIGNASYKDAPLANPVNDARAISAALQESGFTVILRENTDQRGMLAALREFGDKLRGGDSKNGTGAVGLFYYAGHGMQIKGRNYLIPVGANVEREDEVAYSAVDAQAVLDKMEAAGNAANIMILDACRNNPFTRSARSGQAGLAQMDAPVGTLVAFATSPGAVASDGAGANGLYTQHLLTAMRQNGSKVEDVFKQVRANVRRDSQGKQVPWEATSMEGDFYFKGGVSGSNAAVDSGLAVENALWDAVKNSSVPIELRAYLNRYPTGRYAADARARLSQLQSTSVVVAAAPVGAAAVVKPAQVEITKPTPPDLPNEDQAAVDRRTQELLAGLGAGFGKIPAAVGITPVVRPAALSNQFGYTVGDRWRYQKVDKFKGEVVENFAVQVDQIQTNGEMSINRGASVWTADGDVKYSRNPERERFYSGFKQYPAVLQAGAKTSFDYQIDSKFPDGRKWKEVSSAVMVVKGQEKVKTPAGEFDAWRVELEVFWRIEGGDSRGRYTQVSWYVPQLRRYVAWDEESRNANGSFNRRDRYELTSFSVRGAENMALR